MDVLTVSGSFALPLNICCIVFVLILAKTVVVVERDQLGRVFFLMHQGPVEKKIIVHGVDFSSPSFSHKIRKKRATRRISFIGNVAKTRSKETGNGLYEALFQFFRIR